MALYSSPPPAVPFSEAKPTLLVAWWITIFATSIILLRLAGRYIRVEKLFTEDRIVAGALIPLYLRMALVHPVLLYGTNNAHFDGVDFTDVDIDNRVMGSKLVLASRVCYAATLWVLKFATVEFFARLASAPRQRIYVRMIIALRCILGVAFAAVVVSNLAECQPVSHYWQVVPDPGPRCRQGYASLLTTGVASSALDVALVVFPIPIVLSSRIAPGRKAFLVLLFSFGLLTAGVTLYRLPDVVRHHGDQVRRTMWASVELLAATAVANVVAVGSFLRDTGAKKSRYKPSGAHSSSAATESRRGGLFATTATVSANWDRGGRDDDDYGSGKAGRLGDEAGSGLPRKTTTIEIWSREADSTEDDDTRGSKASSSGRRPESRAESHDSLIGPYQRAGQETSGNEKGVLPQYPSAPEPVARRGPV